MKNLYLMGECMIELMAAPNEQSSAMMKQSFAGDVFNTAVYLKRTFKNINTHLVTVIGKDAFSRKMLNYFESEAISTDFVFQSNDKILGLYAIELDSEGERSFTYWRNDSAARQVMNYLNAANQQTLAQGDMFFFSGISLAVIEPSARDQFWQMLEKLKSAGLTIVFDPNYRARMWDSKSQAQIQFEKAFAYADLLLPGVDDFEQLYGINTSEQVYEFCKPYDFDELVIKNGAAGIDCYQAGQYFHFPITPVENVVDTTSAGDSFNGVYLGARLNGTDIQGSISLASNAAGFVIQHHGAIVDKSKYSDFIQSINTEIPKN